MNDWILSLPEIGNLFGFLVVCHHFIHWHITIIIWRSIFMRCFNSCLVLEHSMLRVKCGCRNLIQMIINAPFIFIWLSCWSHFLLLANHTHILSAFTNPGFLIIFIIVTSINAVTHATVTESFYVPGFTVLKYNAAWIILSTMVITFSGTRMLHSDPTAKENSSELKQMVKLQNCPLYVSREWWTPWCSISVLGPMTYAAQLTNEWNLITLLPSMLRQTVISNLNFV